MSQDILYEKQMERLAAALHKAGLKATSQRVAVHKAMISLVHASAEAVRREAFRKGYGKMSAASVYNTLLLLTGLGLYARRLSGDNKMYFDLLAESNFHLYDTVNSSFKDIYDEELMEFIHQRISRRRFRGYHVEGFEVSILARPSKTKKK